MRMCRILNVLAKSSSRLLPPGFVAVFEGMRRVPPESCRMGDVISMGWMSRKGGPINTGGISTCEIVPLFFWGLVQLTTPSSTSVTRRRCSGL